MTMAHRSEDWCFSLTLAALLMAFAVLPASAQPLSVGAVTVPGEPKAEQLQAGQSPISEELFWSIVNASARFEADTRQQAAFLRAELSKLSPEEIQTYERGFDAAMKRSFSWELWGAANVIQGWASDDTFEYFRCWLISKGRRVFERVLADPDSLADILAADSQGDLEFEGFADIARDVWGEKVGKPGREMPNAAWMMYPGVQPSGTAIGSSPFLLAKRYPKLWKRFGHSNLLLRLSGWAVSSLANKSR